jgi:hypothetical protein
MNAQRPHELDLLALLARERQDELLRHADERRIARERPVTERTRRRFLRWR